MALHTELPIYKAAYDLLTIITELTAQFPRNYRASMGEQIRAECVNALTTVARANIARNKVPIIELLLEHLHVIEILVRLSRDMRFISIPQYARTVECTAAIGRQAAAGSGCASIHARKAWALAAYLASSAAVVSFARRASSASCSGVKTDMDPPTGRKRGCRSASEVYRFRGAHPCPATGKARGRCPGWEVDHITALRCGGADVAANMQWLTIEAHRAKSRREARTCPGGWRKRK